MNAILGARIRTLREYKGLTQEQVAENLNCTRQKYARIEKGLIDISYASITSIAEILRVKAEDITSAVNNVEKKEPMFRKNEECINDDGFEFINEMINTFYAHRKLYNSIREAQVNE